MKGVGGGEDTVAGWLVVLFEQLHLSCTHCAKCLGYIRNVRSEPLEVMKYPPASLGLGSVEIHLYCIALFQHYKSHTPHSTSTAVP